MRLSYFEQTQLQGSIMRAWQFAASAQGTPDTSWATIAANAVVKEVGAWDGERERELICNELGEDFWTENADLSDDAYIEVPMGLLRALAGFRP